MFNKRRVYESKNVFDIFDTVWEWKQILFLKWGFKRTKCSVVPKHINCRCSTASF